MDITVSKCLSAILLAIFRLSFARTPIVIQKIIYGRCKRTIDDATFKKNMERGEFYMMILRSFGSGVFLCTCLVHLMPEVVELLYDGHGGGRDSDNYGLISALAQFYICIGFFIIYFIEEFCHWIISKVPNIPVGSKATRSGTNKFEKFIDHIQGNLKDPEISRNTDSFKETVISNVSCNVMNSEKQPPKTITNMIESLTESEKSSETAGNQKITEKSKATNLNRRQLVSFVFNGTGVMLHAFFEGIAIGLQHHAASKVWFLTIAMMIHSATSLFCVGMKFLVIRASTKSIIRHFIIQALASPIGILVGYWILVGGKLEQTLLIDGYFEALSTGTILYITFFEALSKEKQMRVLRVCRSVSMISGFIVMCLLEYFIFLEKSVLSRQYDTIFSNETEH